MTIKTRSQFERFFKGRVFRIRKTIHIDIRQKSGRLNPLILKNKKLVIHNNVAIPIFLIDANNTITNFIAVNILGYRINGNLLMSSNTIQRIKHDHVHMHKRNCRLNGISYFSKRIILCHK